MGFAPELAGPHNPLLTTPARPRDSIRRTSSLDSLRPDGLHENVVMHCRARDLRTGPDGQATVLAHQDVTLTLAPFGGEILAIAADPPEPRLDQFVGLSVAAGFRRQMTQLLPDHAESGSLLHMLLDDLTGASLVAGYAVQRADPESTESAMRLVTDQILLQADICAGWADDATIMTMTRRDRVVPTPLGPPVATGDADDSLAWHDMDPLPANCTRRARRLDLSRNFEQPGTFILDVHFRDSHSDEDCLETGLHEYVIGGLLDATTGVLAAIAPEARVLPWIECPGALASARRVEGMTIDEVRTRVRRELTGVSTCTHLNDTLRGLGDLAPMLAELDGEPTPRKAAS